MVPAGLKNRSEKLFMYLCLLLRHKELLQCTIMSLLNYRIIDRRENSILLEPIQTEIRRKNSLVPLIIFFNFSKVKALAHPAMGLLHPFPFLERIYQVFLVWELCANCYTDSSSGAYFFFLTFLNLTLPFLKINCFLLGYLTL